MMASQHDRLSERPPPGSTISDGWMLALVTAGCAAVVAGLALMEGLG